MSRKRQNKRSRQQNNAIATTDKNKQGQAANLITQGSAPLAVSGDNSNRELGSYNGYMPPPLAGGRQTQPSNPNILGSLSYNFVPRRQWQSIDVSTIEQSGGYLYPQQLLELAAEFNAEVGMALWNKQRLVNSGWEYTVMTPNKTRELKSAKRYLDQWITDHVNPDYGGLNTVINSLVHTAYLQGAVCAELELNEDLSEAADLHAVQPWTIHFQRDENQRLVPYQRQTMYLYNTNTFSNGYQNVGYSSPFQRLNTATFKYIPLDSPPDDPYGRPPTAPVLQYLAFDLQLLKDLRQWAHANAWGRLDATVLTQVLLDSAPTTIKNSVDANVRTRYVNDQIQALANAYAGMNSDDAYFHADSIKMGNVDVTGKTFEVEKLVRVLERKLIRSLKELPVLMGSNEGTTETHGGIQIKIYSRGNESLQEIINTLLESLFTVALQVRGINAVVVGKFKEMLLADALTKVQTDMQFAQLMAYQRDQGWRTQDDVSIQVTGSEAVAPEPKTTQPPQQQPTNTDNGKSNNEFNSNKNDKTNGDNADGNNDDDKETNE
jgi:hypothetical protein